MEDLVQFQSVGFFIVLFVFAVLFLMASFSTDYSRVNEYITNQGGEVLSDTWKQLGSTVGRNSMRIYEFHYRDRSGSIHEALLQTSTFTGVCFLKDKIIQHSNSHKYERVLEEENRQLRERIDELERRERHD